MSKRILVAVLLAAGSFSAFCQTNPTPNAAPPANNPAPSNAAPAQSPSPGQTPNSTPAPSPGASTEVKPAPAPSACLIVKHKGTVGRRLMWTALIGVPIAPGSKYDLVDTINYPDAKTAYKGKELEAIQKSGVHVVVLDNKYSAEQLEVARKSCKEAH
jgi:hypothetical protein